MDVVLVTLDVFVAATFLVLLFFDALCVAVVASDVVTIPAFHLEIASFVAPLFGGTFVGGASVCGVLEASVADRGGCAVYLFVVTNVDVVAKVADFPLLSFAVAVRVVNSVFRTPPGTVVMTVFVLKSLFLDSGE